MCQNRHNLFLAAETTWSDASKLETFILLVRFVFEPELFKFLIGILVLGLENRIMRPIAPKIWTKNNSYVSHLSSKIQVPTFSHFNVVAFFTSVAKFVIFS